jgi:hypothetical protein
MRELRRISTGGSAGQYRSAGSGRRLKRRPVPTALPDVGKVAQVICYEIVLNLLRLAKYGTLDNLEVSHDFAPGTPRIEPDRL